MSTNTLNLLTQGLDILSDKLQEIHDDEFFLPSLTLTDLEFVNHISIDSQALSKSKIIIGTAYDGLPILYDFTRPQSGSVLTVGQQIGDYIPILHSLIHSISRLSRDISLKTIIMMDDSHLPSKVKRGLSDIEVINPYSSTGRRLIWDLVGKIEQRKIGREEGVIYILLVDLNCVNQYGDYDTEVLFEWLLTNGPKAYIFPFVFYQDQGSNISMLLQNPLYSTVILSVNLIKSLPWIAHSINPELTFHCYSFLTIIDGELVPFNLHES